MTSVFAGIKELDPVEGLVSFVLDIKPYHTKIIEVIVEYIYTDPLNVTILDELDWDIFLAEPARLTADGCCDGFSLVNFGNPGVYPIASPNPLVGSEAYPAINPANDTITMLTCGDPKVFTPGSQFRLFAFLEDYSNIHNLIMPSVAVPGDYDFTAPTCAMATVAPQPYDYSVTNCSMGSSHNRLYDYLSTSVLQAVVNTSNVSTVTRTTTKSVFDVFINGVLQREFADYTTTGPTQVTFSQPLQLNDEIAVLQNFNSFYDYLTAVPGQTVVSAVNVPILPTANNIAFFSAYINGILQREGFDYIITSANAFTYDYITGSSGQTIVNTINVPTIPRTATTVSFDVFLNGILQLEIDSYTVTGPNQITLITPLTPGDDIVFIKLFNNFYDSINAIAGQTVFNTINVPTTARTATTAFFDVFINGILQKETASYVVTGPNQITFTGPRVVGDDVVFVSIGSTYDSIVGLSGQTVVTTVNVPTVARTATTAFFDVYVNGVLQRATANYTVTGPNQITLITPLTPGDDVLVIQIATPASGNQITFLQPFQGGEELTFIELKSLGADNIVEGVIPFSGQTVINTTAVPITPRTASDVFFDVYADGVIQRESVDYVVNGPNQITFLQPFQGGEDVFFILLDYLDDDNVYDYITASSGQTIVNTTNVPTVARTVSRVFFDVYVNGLLQQEGIEYTITGANQITFTTPLALSDRLAFIKLFNSSYDYITVVPPVLPANNFDYITSSAGQTIFNTVGTPTIARTASQVFFDVYVNGQLKKEVVEYTITGPNQITFTSPLVLGDRVAFIKLTNSFYDYIASGAGQTIFNTVNVPTTARTPSIFSFDVYVNGILQREVTSYTITGPNQITFISGLVLGDDVIFVSNNFAVADVYDFITGAAAQIVVNTTNVITLPRVGNVAFFEVFLNGILQLETDSYTVTGFNQFTFIAPLVLGDDVVVNQIEAVISTSIISSINVPTIARTANTFYFDVYVNGIFQKDTSAYNITGPNQITFTGPLVVGDSVIFVSNSIGTVNKYDFITGAIAQTVVNTTNITTLIRTATSAFFEVFLNGILQLETDSYTVTGPNQFTFIAPLAFGDDVVVNQIATSAVSGCSQNVNSIVPTTARTPTTAFFEVFMDGLLQREVVDYVVINPNNVSMVIPLSPADRFTFITALNGPYDYITASSGQTIVNTTNVPTLTRTPSQATFDVYVNGLLQQETFDYSITGPNQVTFISPMSVGDSIIFLSTMSGVTLLYDYVVGISGQTAVNTANVPTTARTPLITFFEAYVNGLLQEEGVDYTITGFNQIALTLSLSAGDRVTFTSVLTPVTCQSDVDTVNVTTTTRGATTVFFDVFRNGFLQREFIDYIVTGTNKVTFTTTLISGEDINFLEQMGAQYEYSLSVAAQTIFNTFIPTQARTANTIFTIVYVDGTLQDETVDFNVTGPNKITFTTPLLAGREVTIHFYSIGFIYDRLISAPAQTIFTTANITNLTVRSASQIFFSVYVNGLYQEEGTDYNIINAITIMFVTPLFGGDVVHVHAHPNPIVLFSPLTNFFVLGNQTAQFIPFYTFEVITPSGDRGTYTVTGAGSVFVLGITVIPVFQPIQHFSGIIGVEVTPGPHMFQGIGGSNLYTVKSCVFDNGRIPTQSNPLDPFSLDMGINTHAIIMTIENILSPIPPLGPNQFYVMWITLVPFEIEVVVPYSPAPLVPPYDFPDESAFLNIGSNMFVINQNRLATFHQGVQFDVINGNNVGTYTTLYADFVNGKTRIRTLEGIAFTGIVPGQISFIRPGYSEHETSALTVITGFQLFSATDIGAGVGQSVFNLATLIVPSSNPSLIAVTINGVPAGFTLNTATQFTITSPVVQVNDLISATVYQLPVPGASAFCGNIPPHELRVKFAEKLVFIGISIAEFNDQLIAYNLENTDTYSYELPTTTIFSATTPPIPAQAIHPLGAALFDLWFDTTKNRFRQKQFSIPDPDVNANAWKGIVTAYWFNTTNNKFFKRTKNQFVDTGWFEDVFGGYNQVFPAVGKTTTISTKLFSTGPTSITTFTLTTPVPFSDPSLLGVTINDVPAGFTLNTATQFTITSPTPGIDQIVVATVKDRILTERNAFVGTYNPIPHKIAHTSEFVAVDAINNAFILKGGNFIERFRSNSFEGTGVLVPGGSITWNHDWYPIVHIDGPTKTIVIKNNHTNVFSAAGLVFQVVLSDNNKEFFTVVGSVYNAGTNRTTITVTQVVDENSLFNDLLNQDFSRDLGVIPAIIYNPIVNSLNPLDQVKTLVYPTTPVNVNVDGIEYTWVGPTHFDVGMNYTDLTRIATDDGFGISGNLTKQPDSYNIIAVSAATDEFTIKRIAPTLGYFQIISANNLTERFVISGRHTTIFTPGTQFEVTTSAGNDGTYTVSTSTFSAALNRTTITVTGNVLKNTPSGIISVGPFVAVDLRDSFTSGTQFRIQDSFNKINNFSLVIPPSGPPGTPIQGTPPVAPLIGDYWYDTSTYVRVATTANIILSGIQTIDGKLLVAGDRVLVRKQTSTTQNGVYVVAVGAWNRSLDLDTVVEFVNAVVTVTEGTTQANTNWLAHIDPLGTIGVSSILWTQTPQTSAILRQWNGMAWKEVFVFDFPWTVMSATFNVGPGTTTLKVVENVIDATPQIGPIPQPYFGRIIREPVVVTERAGNTATATIQDTLQFNWGGLVRFGIVLTNKVGKTFKVNGDITTFIFTNDRINVIGTQGNNRRYNVVSVVFSAGQSIITVQETIPVQPALETGVLQLDELDITNWFQYLITDANATTNIFTVYGNATSAIQIGMQIRVLGTANNNGIYTVVVAPTFNGTSTLITVNDILVDGRGGFIESARDYGMQILFRDIIGVSTAEEAAAVVVTTAGSIIDAWDYPFWDVGSFDTSIATEIHLYSNSFPA